MVLYESIDNNILLKTKVKPSQVFKKSMKS